jgi:hypothetical protein
VESLPGHEVGEKGSYTHFNDRKEGCIRVFHTSRVISFITTIIYKDGEIDPRIMPSQVDEGLAENAVQKLLKEYNLVIASMGGMHEIYKSGESVRWAHIYGGFSDVLEWLNKYDPEVPF